MSKWKIEKWTDIWIAASAESLTGKDREEVVKKHQAKYYGRLALGFREIVLLCSAEIDLGLAQLISHKLCDDETEMVTFLGANEDGRAPAGSFGARAQLAYLLGLIDKPTLELIRIIKKLRNGFAHKVNWDWETAAVQRLIFELARMIYIMNGGTYTQAQLDNIRKHGFKHLLTIEIAKWNVVYATCMINCFISKLIPKATRIVPEFIVVKDILG
jgi:hypothetical protein